MFRKTAIGLMLLGSAATLWAQRPRESNEDGPPRGPRNFMAMFPLMTALDADGDGVISPREIKKAVSALKTLDADGDGRLTEDELRPEFPGGGPEGQGGPGGPGGPGGQGGAPGAGGPGGGPMGPPTAEGFVTRAMQFDEDQDGKLSKEELTKMAEQFARGPMGGQRPPRGLQRGAEGAGRPGRGKPPASE